MVLNLSSSDDGGDCLLYFTIRASANIPDLFNTKAGVKQILKFNRHA